MSKMTDPEEKVVKQVVLAAGCWAGLKGEASLNQEAKGVREHAGQILEAFENEELLEKQELENAIENANSLEQLENTIL